MRIGAVILFLSLMLLASESRSQSDSVLTLDEAIATALVHNFDIRLSKNDSTLAALDHSYADYAFLPRLSATGGVLYNNNNQSQTFSDGTARDRNGIKTNNLTGSLNLDWTLFDGGKMFITRKRLTELVRLGELEIKSQVSNSIAAVMNTYYGIVRTTEQLKALDEQMQLSQDRLKLAQVKFEVGTGIKPDVLQAQIDYNTQQATYFLRQADLQKQKAQLSLLMGLSSASNFSVADTMILDPDRDIYTRTDISRNPDLLLALKNIDVANLELREKRAARWPTIEFNSAYNFNRTQNNAVINTFSPLFNQLYGFNYGFTATIPLFNAFRTRHDVHAAEIGVSYQQLLYERSLANTELAQTNARRDLELYLRTVRLQLENIALVRENLNIAKERYRLGLSTYIEMREAEQNLADATEQLIEAQYNAKLAEIELMRISGELVR